MTAIVTQNVSEEPGSAFKRPIAALDAGNRTTQWIDPKGNVRTIPSFVKLLEHWEDAEPCENSVLAGLKQISSPNKAQTRFVSHEYVMIVVQPLDKTKRHRCPKRL